MYYGKKILVHRLLSYIYLDTKQFLKRSEDITFLPGSFHAGLCADIFACSSNILLTETGLFV